MRHFPGYFLLILLFFCILLPRNTFAQPSVVIASFTFDDDLERWENELTNSPQAALWEWSADGRADGGAYWGTRNPINSDGLPGAMMLNADSLQTTFPQDTVIRARVQSSSIFVDDTFVGKKIGICFTQYFRNGGATTSVWAELEGVPLSDPIRLNENIRTNVETTEGNQVTVVLTDSLPAPGKFDIFFDFEGLLYFWIIDDIVVKTLPDYYGGTFPAYVGDSLGLVGRPYEVDSLGGAYKPNSLVVRWAPGTTEQEKEDIRTEFALVRSDTCLCREIESVTLVSELVQDPAANLIEFGDLEDGNSNLYFQLANTQNGAGCNPPIGYYAFVGQAVDACGANTWVNVAPPSGVGNMAVVVHNETLQGVEEVLQIPNIPVEPGKYYFLSFDIYLNINTDAPDVPVLRTSNLGSMEFVWDNDDSQDDPRINISPGGWFNYQAVYKALGTGVVLDLEYAELPSGAGVFAFGLDNLYLADVSELGGRALDIIETKNGGGANNMVQDIDYNYYTRSYFRPDTAEATPPALELSDQTGASPLVGDEIVIAIIDTGVDWDHACFQGKAWVNNGEFMAVVANGADDDGNCVEDDFIGWNFVADYNNPFDDHGHGTHVACIALENAENFSPPDNGCEYRIMPLKALAFDGVGELFHAACATLYAIENGADVINCSFIWNGGQSDIMDGLIDEGFDAGAFFVAAAGNDTLDLGLHEYYPANYGGKLNMLTVGAIKDNTEMAPFSNYNNLIVEIAAEGVGINSALSDIMPENTNRGFKSGTSMAAPRVAAGVAIRYCLDGPEPSLPGIRDNIMGCADQIMAFEDFLIGGNVLNLSCTIIETEETARDIALRLFPNPTAGPVQAEPAFSLAAPFVVEAFGLTGELLYRSEREGLPPGGRLELDFSGLPAGMYVLRIYQGGQSWAGRFVKE